MHSNDIEDQFAELRAKGLSLARITAGLHVSQRTPIAGSISGDQLHAAQHAGWAQRQQWRGFPGPQPWRILAAPRKEWA